MQPPKLVAAVALVLLVPLTPAAVADDRRAFRLDAVELIAGRETPGVESLQVQHGPHNYWFATAENKAAFEREPAKYEIQFGGACARMGPLSGACGCDIFAVHDGKLYVFASPQCREAFLRAPQKLLETDDEPPTADGDAATRGRDLLELAVKFCGGAAKIDGMQSFRQRIEATSEHEGKPVLESSTFTAAFPDRFRFEDTWGKSMWGHAIVGDTGFFLGSDASRSALVASQVRAAKRNANRHLLVLLRARTQPGFVVAALDEANTGATGIERVAVGFDGTTTTLWIDRATGMVQRMSFPSRGPRSTIGVIDKTITEYKDVAGVQAPWSWTSTFDGDEKSARTTTLTLFEVDPKLDASAFEAKKP